MTRYVIYSDFHFHDYKQFANDQEITIGNKTYHATDRIAHQLNALEEIYDFASKHDANVIFAGDFFHARKAINPKIFNMAMAKMKSLHDKYSSTYTFMIDGNHDQADNTETTVNSIEPFGYISDRIHVFSEPSVLSEYDVNLHFLPFTVNTEKAKEIIQEWVKREEGSRDFQLLVSHLGVEGASTGKFNHKLEGAFGLGDLYPDAFDYVFLGHYHKRQHLTDNVVYVGNTIPTDFSDEQEKGFYYLNLERITFGENPLSFHPIDSPMFLTVTDVSQIDEDTFERNYVKVRLPEEQFEELDLKYEGEEPNLLIEKEKTYEEDSRLDIEQADTKYQIISKVSEHLYPEQTGLKNKALEVLKEAEQDV